MRTGGISIVTFISSFPSRETEVRHSSNTNCNEYRDSDCQGYADIHDPSEDDEGDAETHAKSRKGARDTSSAFGGLVGQPEIHYSGSYCACCETAGDSDEQRELDPRCGMTVIWPAGAGE